MWETFVGFIPSGLILFCAALSVIIPWTIYTINQLLHKHGDPPWMKEK